MNGGATLGFEEQLWRAAVGLRGHVEPAEYKHMVLGLLFLKYITSNGASHRSADSFASTPPFIVPASATWSALMSAARAGDAAKALTSAMTEIEAHNPALRGLLTFDVRRVNGERLAELMAVLGAITLDQSEGDSRDVLGRVYEYFLAKFASSEGRSGGEYYTPRAVVQLLVEMIRPFAGTIYDPCCGTAGMFVQSERIIVEHGGRSGDVAIFGQESSPTTFRLAKMNLALRGIHADLGLHHADTFHADLHPTLKADFVLANPPFNARGWGADKLENDQRWRFGTPPLGNANYAWIQHIFSHLKPAGIAGFVLSNGSLSSDQSGEAQLRQRMIEADIIECIVALPSQLFYGTQIPACLWFVSPTKTRCGAVTLATRTLFIDARARGHLVDRGHADLLHQDVADIASAYHRWRAEGSHFNNVPGFAKSVSIDEIRQHKYALVPGRYVGFARDRAPAFDPARLSVEIDDARARLGEIDMAAKRFLAKMEALRRG
jgi:type I restriction enzyme M protein